MASSVPSAIIELWDSIPATAFGGTTRPPLRLNSMQQTDSAGAQQRIPYGVLYDDGLLPFYDSSFGGIEGGEFRLELFAFALDAATGVTATDMALAAKYGGQPPSAKAGLDWGTLPIIPYHYNISCKRVREQYMQDGVGRDSTGNLKPVHKCILTYRIVVGLKITGIWTGFWGFMTYP